MIKKSIFDLYNEQHAADQPAEVVPENVVTPDDVKEDVVTPDPEPETPTPAPEAAEASTGEEGGEDV